MHALWLAVLLLTCEWANACPKGCSCYHDDQGLNAANCSSLPSTGGKIETLTIVPAWDSKLELSDGQFSSARHLKYLNLTNSSIYFIHKKAFYGAKNLFEVDLSFNYIEELEPTVFQHLKNFTILVLRGNPIQFMSEVPFLISSSLQQLDIGLCKLKSLPRGIFYELKLLRYLLLDGNHLKSVEYNTLPKGLRYLNLSRNLIVNVPTEEISSLRNIKRIDLSGNPVNCSCPLLNLQDWLSGQGVIFENDVICESPSEYYGISWRRVNENKLCLAEAEREEMSHSASFNRLFGLFNRLKSEDYSENENSNLEDNIQSDQPQSVLPESQAEVLFQNDDTIAMGEMMRDEEAAQETTHIPPAEKLDELSLIGDTPAEEKDTGAKPRESQEGGESPKEDNTENKNEVTILIADSNTDNIQESKVEDNLAPTSKIVDNNVENEVNIDNPIVNNDNENIVSTEDKLKEDNLEIDESKSNLDLSQGVSLNEGKPVEYKPLSGEEPNTEVDDFKKEGLFHVDSEKYTVSANETEEDSTAIPVLEDTTEDEAAPTEEVLIADAENNEAITPNSTSDSEISSTTTVADVPKSEEDKVTEIIPPPILVPDLHSNNETVDSNIQVAPKSANEPSNDSQERKVTEVAGADVLMFCIGVLMICLVLYSVYKCRSSSERPNTRTVKDMESNNGTELQDMASLLPKPQEEIKKNNLKYPDKAPPSETMKLISERNENEAPRVEDKNSINNNAPTSQSGKTPLRPGNQITINPAAPIQRTKVKVGIIPDSIPRTPIFLQKTYNGTKNV